VKLAAFILVLFPLLAVLAPAATLPVSQLDLRHVDSLRGLTAPPPQPDLSAEGRPITIAGHVYKSGVGTRGVARLQVELDGEAKTLHAWTGVTDDTKSPGPVWFEVVGDGRMLYAGDPIKQGDAAREISVPLTGVKTLALLVQSPDQIDPSTAWADANIDYVGEMPKSVAPPLEKTTLLTPVVPPVPRLNGPAVFGARPDSPLLFTIAASGERPMEFSAEGLPDGVNLDTTSGRLTGVIPRRSEYRIQVTAKNSRGTATREIKLVIGDTLALTPPMGWNSWNCFAEAVTASDVRSAADAFVRTGLMQHGWSYVNIDDFWMMQPAPDDPIFRGIADQAKAKGMSPMQLRHTADPTLLGSPRDAQSRINSNPRFPDMTGLAGYVHSLGLKIGLYSSPGPFTCGRCIGSYGHEADDAARFAEWGFDYLKYDWCSYRFYTADDSRAELVRPYHTMGEALRAQPRDIVFSLCQYGLGDVWTWGASTGGQLWRTTRDIIDTWPSMAGIGFSQNGHEQFAGPGRWNDPDMLVVGQVGWGPSLHPTRLTPDEQFTHVSLWCLQAAPLLIGCDLTKLDDFTLSLLTNDEVIAVDQDPLGRPAGRVARDRNLEVWARPLADGALAVGLFNRGELPATVTASWIDLNLRGAQQVRDLWRQQNLGSFTDTFSAEVPRHGVVLVKITSQL